MCAQKRGEVCKHWCTGQLLVLTLSVPHHGCSLLAVCKCTLLLLLALQAQVAETAAPRHLP